jgi:hypothetical protein
MKITPKPISTAAVLLAAVLDVAGFGASASHASSYGDAPWCAVIDEVAGNIVWQCEYNSAAECAPHVIAGNRGFCQHNPYYREVAPQDDQAVPPPGASRWRDIGHGNYVRD